MKQLWNSTVAGLAVWKLALVKVFLVSFISGGNVLQTSMSGVEWDALTTTQRILVFNGVFIAVAGSIVAFLDRTMSRIEEKKNGNGGDKTHLTGFFGKAPEEKIKLP